MAIKPAMVWRQEGRGGFGCGEAAFAAQGLLVEVQFGGDQCADAHPGGDDPEHAGAHRLLRGRVHRQQARGRSAGLVVERRGFGWPARQEQEGGRDDQDPHGQALGDPDLAPAPVRDQSFEQHWGQGYPGGADRGGDPDGEAPAAVHVDGHGGSGDQAERALAADRMPMNAAVSPVISVAAVAAIRKAPK
ncbi:hypothetical protein L3Q67_41375 [Saccharothrix sp. AJ9571]|nr:hypothetical protein L3Q67_41375 [Saccharothrix sp. AJ9571]